MTNHSVIGFEWHIYIYWQNLWMWILAATSGAKPVGATIRLTTFDHRIEVAS